MSPAMRWTTGTANERSGCRCLGLRGAGLGRFSMQPDKQATTGRAWFLDASTDPETIKAWFRKWPNAMLAVATGAASGIVVLDVDRDDEKGVDGEASLAGLLNGASLPPDLTAVRTPRGGRHLYFGYPEGVTIRNSAGKLGPASMCGGKAAM